MGYPRLATASRKYLFILLVVGFVVANFLNWYVTHHFMEIKIEDRYQIELSVHELESFLDWSIAFEIEVDDLKSGTNRDFEFNSDGPYFQVLVSAENQIWLKGYDHSSGQDWLMDLNGDTINSSSPNNDQAFELIAEITHEFEIVKR